jgi:hypothetical protein
VLLYALIALQFFVEGFSISGGSISLPHIGGIVAASYITGFITDSLGLYKIHPVYRRIRKQFFLSLYKMNEENSLPSGEKERILSENDKIQIAENIREDILYEVEPIRYKNLRIEHAIWIMLYNFSIITNIYVAMTTVTAFIEGITQVHAIVLITLIAFSILSLLSARARNISYGEKLQHVAKNRKQKKSRAVSKKDT